MPPTKLRFFTTNDKKSITTLIQLLWWGLALVTLLNIAHIKTDSDETSGQQQLWPSKQLNVLVDSRSLNETEQQIIEASLDQIEHKTCVRINRLQANRVNPFDLSGRQLGDKEKNFVYIFKSHIGIYNRPPPIGLSTFGCALKGRQSVVLTDAAFKFPETVLKYHLLRTLGVRNLKKPSESQLESQQLPLSQKIAAQNNTTTTANFGKGTKEPLASVSIGLEDALPAYFAYATGPIDGDRQAPASRPTKQYLADDDLALIKQLYDCSDYQNRLSVKPIVVVADQPAHQGAAATAAANVTGSDRSSQAKVDPVKQPEKDQQTDNSTNTNVSPMARKLKSAEESLRQIINSVALEKGTQVDSALVENAAKSIVHYLLTELEGEPMSPAANPAIKEDGQRLESLLDSLDGGQPQCQPAKDSSCSGGAKHHQERSTSGGQNLSSSTNSFDQAGQEARPMLLKLDSFHANDPQLKQANQMKLSQLNGSSDAMLVPQTYRLLNQTPQPLLGDLYGAGSQSQKPAHSQSKGKSEMMISFEQTPDTKNPIDALAGSQVLKLCSCTCQTMTPSSISPQPPSPRPTQRPTITDSPNITELPTYPTFPTAQPPPSTSSVPSKPATPTTKPMTTEPPPLPPWTLTDYPSIPSDTPTWPSIDPSLTDYPLTDPWTPWTPKPSQKPATKQPTTLDGQESSTYPETFTYAPTVKPGTSPLPPLSPLPPTPTQRPTTATTDSDEPNTDPNDHQWLPPVSPTPTPSKTTTTTTTAPNNATNSNGDDGPPPDWSACDQVQWVKPNKTIYSSAKIVWDVDRANQNYFLCNAQLDGELIPGKTHGLSCKVSSEGKAYEMHQFQVLIKPESVNLAWVQKDSKSFGSKNLPVIGGYSKSATAPTGGSGSGSSLSSTDKGDPYVVSRCLVRDENNDVITLIGYINRQNVGWFPFDDIQIECSQYDVLACVN